MTRRRLLVLFAPAAGLVLLWIGTRLAAQPEPLTYVGSKKCKKCHYKRFKAWEESAHGHALANLDRPYHSKTDDITGKKCLACHVTGLLEEGGFRSLAATPELGGVGCESCHGAGSRHTAHTKAALKEMKSKGLDLGIARAKSGRCLDCHNPHVSYKELYGK